jgi:hypothetical protein
MNDGLSMGPVSPRLVVSPSGAAPLSQAALEQIASARPGVVLFEAAAFEAWRAQGAYPVMSNQISQSPLITLDPRPAFASMARLQEDAIGSAEEATFADDIALESEWQGLRPHARKVWRKLIPLLPFQFLRDSPLLWPGLIAFNRSRAGATTIRELLTGSGMWDLPRETTRESKSRPSLGELSEWLSHIPAGRAALKELIALGASDFTTVCILERHLEREERWALGTAIDRACRRVDQCLSLSPLTRSTPSGEAWRSGRAVKLGMALGADCYGDLGRYAFGFRVAYEYPVRSPQPSDAVRELSYAARKMRKAVHGRSKPAEHLRAPVRSRFASTPDEQTLASALIADCAAMDRRHTEILRRRMGIDGAIQSLYTIGRGYGLSRERVRQIEGRACRQLIHTRRLFYEMKVAAQEWLASHRRPMLPCEWPRRGGDCGVDVHDHVIAYCIRAWAFRELLIVYRPKRTALLMSATGMPFSSVRALVANIIARLPPSADLRIQRLKKCQAFKRLPADVRGGFELAIKDPSGPFGGVFGVHRPRAAAMLRAAMAKSLRALTVAEAVHAVAGECGVTLQVSRAHACLTEIAFPLGRQQYGLAKHLVTPKTLAKQVARYSDQFALRACTRGEELRLSSIRSALGGTAIAADILGMTNFELAAALRIYSQRLMYIGRFTFRVGGDGPRTTGAQVALNVLSDAGCPLPTGQIVDAVRIAAPGLAYQVRPSQRIARVQAGVWGLRGRDFEVEEQRLEAIFQWLQEVIESSGPVSHTHIRNCPSYQEAVEVSHELNTLTVADLAHATGRFRLGRRGILDVRGDSWFAPIL